MVDDLDTTFIARVANVRERLDDERTVALTFDDGPDPQYTPRTLDALAGLGVTATFFLVGARAALHPHLVERIVAEGHEVGSHSYDHPEPGTLSVGALGRNYRAGRRAVEDAAGRAVRRFRPPKGFIDRAGAVAVRAAGMTSTWLWTTDPNDWAPGASADAIAAHPSEPGAVWLLHDGLQPPVATANDRSETIAALAGIVARLQRSGMRFVVLPT
jgi:peptidoglycan/xylan/chitin deacetylase (PgdA/CDA1 family)